jgi:hypothetical protein
MARTIASSFNLAYRRHKVRSSRSLKSSALQIVKNSWGTSWSMSGYMYWRFENGQLHAGTRKSGSGIFHTMGFLHGIFRMKHFTQFSCFLWFLIILLKNFSAIVIASEIAQVQKTSKVYASATDKSKKFRNGEDWDLFQR